MQKKLNPSAVEKGLILNQILEKHSQAKIVMYIEQGYLRPLTGVLSIAINLLESCPKAIVLSGNSSYQELFFLGKKNFLPLSHEVLQPLKFYPQNNF